MSKSEDVDHAKIARVLAGELETTVLNAEEKSIWSEQFITKMAEPGPEEEAFFLALRNTGKAIGLDKNGRITYARPSSEGIKKD